jgi:hypothetical protein
MFPAAAPLLEEGEARSGERKFDEEKKKSTRRN